MWTVHLCNLVKRAWFVMVARTGTNTLGFFVWTLALTLLGWLVSVADGFVRNHKNHIARPLATAVEESRTSGMLLLGGVVILVLALWAFFSLVVVYEDHTSLAAENVELREKLDSKSGATMKIKGWITNQDQNHNANVQMWLAVDNNGNPTTFRDWQISIKTDHLIEGRHQFGQQALKGGLSIPFLDAEFQRPVATVADMQGYVTFGFIGINQKQVNDLHLDHSASFVVSARDSRGRSVTAEKSIFETWNEGHETRPAK